MEGTRTFDECWAGAERSLFRLAMHLTRNREDADDLLQTTRIRTWKAFETYRQTNSFNTWSTTIMKRYFFDTKRRSKRRVQTLSYEDVKVGDDGDQVIEFPDLGISAEDRICDESATLFLLGSLPPNERSTIEMILDGLTYEEIAKAHGIKAVRAKIRRARKRSQQRLFEIGVVA